MLPQKPPIVMVDTLIDFDAVSARSRLLVRENNIFVQNGRLSVSGMLENIAQTCAAQAIAVHMASDVRENPIGFIGAISHLEVSDLPPVHATIETAISVLNQVMNVTIIKGSVTHEGREMAQCEMKIFIRP